MTHRLTPAQAAALAVLAPRDSVTPTAFYHLRWPGRRVRRGRHGEDTTGMVAGSALSRLERAGLAARHYGQGEFTPRFSITTTGRTALAAHERTRP